MKTHACRPLALIAAGLLAAGASQAQPAADAGAPGLRLNGFGSIGVVDSRAPAGWGFRRDISQPDHDGGVRADTDSRLGLQLNATVNGQLEFVGQLLLKRRLPEVPAGDSVGQIGDLLASEGVISNATLFEIRATLSGKRGELNHGVHQFRKDMSYSAAIDELTRTTSKRTITVTIPEGLSRSETADVVAAAGIPGDYMAASVKVKGFNPDDYGAQGRAENLEGFLFPATYEMKPTADVEDLIDEQLQAFRDNIAGVDMKYARSKNLTVYDILTIASMIEREVSVPKERRTVAAVIYNRLKMGEPLGIDATIRFALDNWTEPLTEADLATDSPYNTRLNGGLPPGPIGNPGLASIEAAANPAKTDVWLYVVKPGTCGEHVFSSSLEEHNRNVQKYEDAQAEAGGSPTEC